MSENEPENEPGNEPGQTSGIPDDQLPADLVPGEENPLAEGLADGEGSDLLEGGKTAEEMDDPTEADEKQDSEKQAGPAHEHD